MKPNLTQSKQLGLLNKNGQTALILILLTAATLIFFAISLNWGRIAQTKAVLTIAADESAALLASDAASYGEMQKQTYLQNQNQITELNGVLLDIIVLIIIIVVAYFTWGTGATAAIQLAGEILTVAAGVVAIGNIALQLAVLQPLITQLWNKLQANQPIQQQFFEEGISGALQGAVGDQVNITDFLDWNANGSFGYNVANSTSNDIVSRFALFYSDRLKMLNKPDIPAVVNFYDQLGILMNGGETCAQNITYNKLDSGIPVNGTCAACVADPSNLTACQQKIPNGFQLNDECLAANAIPYLPGTTTINPAYNPYCDPCCQIATLADPMYNATTPNPLHPTPDKILRPSGCPQILGAPDTTAWGAPVQCWINNPFDLTPNDNTSLYTLLYDPSYQNNYSSTGTSFLEQFGRDQQMPMPGPPPSQPEPPFTELIPQGHFPSGIFPLFWLMKDYSLEVDNIDPSSLSSDQYHWCVPTATTPNLVLTESNTIGNPSFTYPPPGYPELTQLGTSNSNANYTLPYTCSGADCCVNFLPDTLSASGVPMVDGTAKGTTNGSIDMVGSKALSTGGVTNQNLARDETTFGEPGLSPSEPWMEGDNQFCSNPVGTTPMTPLWGWTYNGSSTTGAVDGTCEWINIAPYNPPPGATPSSTFNSKITTVDALDDTLHTLSDFVDFSNNFLGQNVDTLSSTFSTWYPQVANWIAPAADNSSCDDNSQCVGGQCTDLTACTPATDGRLLTAANNLAAWSATPGPITDWQKQLYASSDAWCLPPAPATTDPNWYATSTASDCSSCTGTCSCAASVCTCTSPTAELSAIGDPPSSLTWGNLSDVIACLNYNSSQAASNYNACLQALNTDNTTKQTAVDGVTKIGCLYGTSFSSTANPTSTGQPCDPAKLGRSLTGLPAPTFTPSKLGTVPACDTSCVPTGDSLVQPCSQSSTPSAPTTSPGQGITTDITYTDTNNYYTGSCCAYDTQACTPSTAGCTSSCTTATAGCASTCSCSGTPSVCACSTSTCGSPCTSSCTCPSTTYSPACTASPAVPTTTSEFQSFSCDSSIAGTYANWVQTNYTLANDESPKFLKRATYLQDVSSGVQNLLQVTSNGGATLSSFVTAAASPSQQLITASKSQPAASLPNSVIYGWQDATPTGGSGGCMGKDDHNNPIRVGCSHMVKVTAYSAGRAGIYAAGGGGRGIFWPNIPEVKTSSGFLQRSYTLTSRDGPVYVSVKRWDQDHTNALTFPNNHPLWQFMFHNPNGSGTTGSGLPSACIKLNPTGSLSSPVGYGLESNTINGMVNQGLLSSQQDQTSLAQAFMLNDNGNGQVDPVNLDTDGQPGSVCTPASTSNYCQCMYEANQLLNTGMESHACVQYIASSPGTGACSSGNGNKNGAGVASGHSGTGDCDYSLKFVPMSSCGSLTPSDDDLNDGG